MTADEVLTRAAPPPDLVLSYGPQPGQVADLRLPARAGQPAPLVLFLHGGFWRAAYDRAHTGPLATALAGAGYAVCVPEFRRTGQPSGGWPGTFDDVAAAVDTLPALVVQAAGDTVARGPVLLAGHSAGGHLALWAAARHRLPAGARWHTAEPGACGVVALAAVCDLTAAHQRGLGQDAVGALLGGGPRDEPGRYAVTDPARLLPLGCPAWLVHGTEDDGVPCQISRDYAARARAAGDDIVLDELPGTGHFEVIDPLSAAWPRVLAAFAAAGGAGGTRR